MPTDPYPCTEHPSAYQRGIQAQREGKPRDWVPPRYRNNGCAGMRASFELGRKHAGQKRSTNGGRPKPKRQTVPRERVKRIGAAIQAERTRRGWSRPELEYRADVGASTIRGIERGLVGSTVRTLTKVYRALGWEVDGLKA